MDMIFFSERFFRTNSDYARDHAVAEPKLLESVDARVTCASTGTIHSLRLSLSKRNYRQQRPWRNFVRVEYDDFSLLSWRITRIRRRRVPRRHRPMLRSEG